MIIIKHLPALQVLIPFFAALLTGLTFHKFTSWLITTIAVGISLALAYYGLNISSNSVFYSFGNWAAPIGVEYRLDDLNQSIILYINAVLLFFLLFGKQLINQTITKYIDKKKHHLFYSLILFAHAGYVGVLSTNDLFNMYVFIEISSLATYVLISQGNNPRALIGAYDYLTLGTIGATLILISIGFFFSLTGSLNISDISHILQNTYETNATFNFNGSKILITATVFFLSGIILKMAFFPLHFWMIRAYSSTAPFILTYLAAISSIIGIYMIMRFIHFTIKPDPLYPFFILLRFMSMMTIIICTYLALKSSDLKNIIIYSSASQIGYVFLLLSFYSANQLLWQFLILDSINKIGLFTLISHIQNKTTDLNVKSIKQIKNSYLFKILAAFIILFSAALPITSMFIIKVQILEFLINTNLILEFIIVIIGSILSILYHLKLAKGIFLGNSENGAIEIDTNLLGMITIVIIHVLTLLYINMIIPPQGLGGAYL